MAKILVIPRWYPSEEKPGDGIFVKEFVKAKSLYNHVVVLHAELTKNGHPKFPYEIQDQEEDGIRTVRFIYKRLPFRLHRLINLIGFIDCLSKVNKEGLKPDILHFHEYLASIPAFIYAKIKHIPIVITEHYSGFIKENLTFFERLLAKMIMNRADIVLPVSYFLKSHIENYATKCRFEVVPNIVDVSIFKVMAPAMNKNDKVKQMLIVSGLSPNKGISYLLDALSLLKKVRTDFHLDIVGDGEIRKELEKQKSELGLDEFVTFHGRKLKSEVAEYMSKCDFYVLPSLFETFGCVIIEAMACGKPIVATDCGGPREIVTSESGIVVKCADTKALMDGINYMMDNYYGYSAENISRYAAENYGLEAVGQKLNQIYIKIANT
jgi:L-malate glycosyltransferase